MFIAYDVLFQGEHEAKSNDVYERAFVSVDLRWFIIAQGELITSAWNTGDTAFNTLSGTSMACPHVVPKIDPYFVEVIVCVEITYLSFGMEFRPTFDKLYC